MHPCNPTNHAHLLSPIPGCMMDGCVPQLTCIITLQNIYILQIWFRKLYIPARDIYLAICTLDGSYGPDGHASCGYPPARPHVCPLSRYLAQEQYGGVYRALSPSPLSPLSTLSTLSHKHMKCTYPSRDHRGATVDGCMKRRSVAIAITTAIAIAIANVIVIVIFMVILAACRSFSLCCKRLRSVVVATATGPCCIRYVCTPSRQRHLRHCCQFPLHTPMHRRRTVYGTTYRTFLLFRMHHNSR